MNVCSRQCWQNVGNILKLYVFSYKSKKKRPCPGRTVFTVTGGSALWPNPPSQYVQLAKYDSLLLKYQKWPASAMWPNVSQIKKVHTFQWRISFQVFRWLQLHFDTFCVICRVGRRQIGRVSKSLQFRIPTNPIKTPMDPIKIPTDPIKIPTDTIKIPTQ